MKLIREKLVNTIIRVSLGSQVSLMENVGALELPHSTTSDQTPQDHGREQQFLPHKTGKAVGRAEGSKPCRLSAAPRTPRAESTAATLLLSVSQQ